MITATEIIEAFAKAKELTIPIQAEFKQAEKKYHDEVRKLQSPIDQMVEQYLSERLVDMNNQPVKVNDILTKDGSRFYRVFNRGVVSEKGKDFMDNPAVAVKSLDRDTLKITRTSFSMMIYPNDLKLFRIV